MTHLPPVHSKWNKIEHRLFAFITQNWRGKPLVSHQVIVQLIGATTTDTGLKVYCELDANLYPKGIKVTEREMQTINIARHDFHGEWNYTVSSLSNCRVDRSYSSARPYRGEVVANSSTHLEWLGLDRSR